MPPYKYVCKGIEFIVFLSIKAYEAHPMIKCPHWESDNVERIIKGFFTKTGKKS
jgi:hypothetical protein